MRLILVIALATSALFLTGCGSTTEKNDGSQAMQSNEPALSYEDAMKARPRRSGAKEETAAPSTDGESGR